ncbi:unnamed protein product [Thelazia callipaeda]|uniref:Coiled-coil domain-containing protein 176 n=1 Tax=Thelazia callipaeda TaxID=103827 RepID=A0A158RC67_THECL|nr:unnamed protein product [Thelazia callipaeda]
MGDAGVNRNEGEEQADEAMKTEKSKSSRAQHASLFGKSSQEITNLSSVVESVSPEYSTAPSSSNISHDKESENIVNNVTELKRENVRLEHVLFLANEELDSLRNKLSALSKAQKELREENESLMRDRSQRVNAMRKIEAERDQIYLAKNEFENKAEMLLRQKEDYEANINRLCHDKSLIANALQLKKNELSKLLEKNVLLEAKINECEKQKRMIEFEKERWAQEKEIYLHNKDWFLNEIKERDRKFAVLRIEMVKFTGELQAEVASITDKYESAKNDVSKLTSKLNDRDKELSRLNTRIKEIFEENTQKMMKLEEELLTSERLCAVYKEASDDAESNLRELARDFENRGNLIDKSKKAFESMCEEFEEKERTFIRKIAEKDKKIENLLEELDKANDLLKSRHRVMLSDDEIMELSPAAAAASSLIRNSVSLTGIYREHCRVVAELEEAKVEKKQIESYFRQVVEDIEAKAPLLAQQRAEYNNMSDSLSSLQKQLQSVEEERQKLENSRDATVRELTYTRAELERYQRDVEDLNKQIRHLLHVLEIGKANATDEPPMDEKDREILWTSIAELQRINQKLMSDLRTASANHDRAVEEAKNHEISRLNDLLNDAGKKLDFLKDENFKQNLVIDELKKQRDSYKKMSDERKTVEESFSLTKQIDDLRCENANLRGHIEQAEKSLDLFREEKTRSDGLLQSRIDQQFALISELRKTNGKFESDIEMQKQTQLMLIKQSESDSSELNLAREKAAKMQSMYTMTDERCRKLQEELMETKEEVAKYKTDVEALMEKLSFLRSTEAQLQQELRILRESDYSNEKMSHILKQLENRLQYEDEDRMRMFEDQLTLAKNENESLKKFVSEISEQHRLISLDLKITTNKIQAERDQALASKKSAEDHLALKENELNCLQTKYDDLINQLKAPDDSLESSDDGYKKEAQQLRNRNNYLENQLKEIMTKLEVSEKMVAIREQELADISKLSSNMESTLVEQGASAIAERNSLEAILNLVKKQLSESVALVEKQRTEIATLEQKVQDEANKTQQMKIEKLKEYQILERHCCSLDIEKSNAESRIRELELENAKIVAAKTSIEEEFKQAKANARELEHKVEMKENEVQKLSSTVAELGRKCEDIRHCNSSEVAGLRVEKNRIEIELQEAKKLVDEQKQKLETVNDNLLKLIQRMSVLERSMKICTSNEDGAGNSDSTTPLYDVIKYLQTENRQAMERMMNAELQWKRLQAQLTIADENRLKLEEEIVKVRKENETNIRLTAEKSEMVARLELLEKVQKENQALKMSNEKLVQRVEQLAKNASDLQVRVTNLNAEKITEKGRLQNLCNDLQASHKELESWKERHNLALVSLGKFGPDKVVALNNEIESLKRKLSLFTTERDSLKKEMEKLVQESTFKEALTDVKKKFDESESERTKLSAKFEQARIFARRYRMKSQTLEKEVEELKEQIAEKISAEEEANAEVARLKQELFATRSEMERQKQKHMFRSGWPVESGLTVTQSSKTNLILQTQLKQLEGLSQQNKDLSRQLEESAEKYRMAQTKLNEAEIKLRETRAESDTKDELRFRINSITSIVTKKEEEVNRLQKELATIKQSNEACHTKIKSLEAALSACRSGNSKRSDDPSTSVKPVSSSTSAASQRESSSFPTFSTTDTTIPHCSVVVPEKEIPTTSHFIPSAGYATTMQVAQQHNYENIKQEDGKNVESHPILHGTLVSTTSEQSNTVSQSTAGDAHAQLQQHSVTSAGSDGTNVITSSVASGDLSAIIEGVSVQMGSKLMSERNEENIISRKRTFAPSNEQVETGSGILEPRKRHRGSPLGQVSTSGRFMKLITKSQVDIEQHTVDVTGHEQQENVETTTSTEGDDSNSTRASSPRKTAISSVEIEELDLEVRNDIIQEEMHQGHDEEVLIENSGSNAVLTEEVKHDASADEDDLSEEAGDEMSEEELDEEEFDDEEPDEEEEFELRQSYGTLYAGTQRRDQLRSGNEDDDDDDVILITDDDEITHSHFSVDLSMDEAHGDGSESGTAADDDIEICTAETREPENFTAPAQQVDTISRMDLSSSDVYVTAHVESHQDRSKHVTSETHHIARLEHAQSLSLYKDSQEVTDVVSGSELCGLCSSPPLIEVTESDIRGASSTVAPPTSTDVDSGDSEHGLVIEESKDEVIAVECEEKRVAQTDEGRSMGPSTSHGLARRIRIRYPDITEPTSSSSDASQLFSGTFRRGGRSARSRRRRGRYGRH